MDKINYIHQINNFWRFYDLNKNNINVSDIVLYKILLRYCNKIGWINPFTVNPFLMAEINPLSINTYYKSLKRLNDIGLITYIKGKHNVSNQSITILKIKNSTNTSIDNSIMTSVKNSTNTSVVNNNKTDINSITVKQLKKKDFDFLVNSKEFKSYLKTEGLKINNDSGFDFSFIKNNFSLNGETEKFEQIFKTYIDYRKEIKKAYKSQKSLEIGFKQLLNKSKTDYPTAKIMIENTIANGWTGLIEVKQTNNYNNNTVQHHDSDFGA